MRADSFDLYVLNSSASYAWRLLRSGKSLWEASGEFSSAYCIPYEVASDDMQNAWSDWQQTLLGPFVPEPPLTAPLVEKPGEPTFAGTYSFGNRRIRVVLHGLDLVDEIIPRLAPLTISVSRTEAMFEVIGSESGYHIYLNSSWLASRTELSEARITLLQEFVRYAMPDLTWLATVHAAACGDGTHCVLFPAASHSGKTTLAAALMHAGFLLYAEDSAVLHAGTLTVPMTPFSLMIREGSWPVVMPRFPELANAPVISHSGIDVRFLPPRWDGQPRSASVSAIVFSQYVPGSITKLKSLDTFETLLRLQESGFWVAHDRESIAEFLQWLAERPTYSLTYCELDEAIPVIRDLLTKLTPAVS